MDQIPEHKQLLAMQYFHSGVESFFEGAAENARKDLLLALEMDQNLVFAYCYLSSIYCDAGKHDEGIHICRQGLTVQPQNTYLHFCLGLVYLQKKLYAAAIEEFSIYLTAAPGDVECLFMLASAYDELNNSSQSRHYYHAVLRCEPLHFRSHFNLGLLEEKEGRLERAIVHFKQIVGIHPDYWKAWVRLGILYFKRNQIEDAVKAYLEAIKYQHQLPDVHYNLGISYRLLHDPHLAIQSFKSTIALLPTDADAWYNLGMAYLDLRDYLKAKEAMFQALHVRLEHPEAHYRLGYIYLLLGEFEKAHREYCYLRETNSSYVPLLKEMFVAFGFGDLQ